MIGEWLYSTIGQETCEALSRSPYTGTYTSKFILTLFFLLNFWRNLHILYTVKTKLNNEALHVFGILRLFQLLNKLVKTYAKFYLLYYSHYVYFIVISWFVANPSRIYAN